MSQRKKSCISIRISRSSFFHFSLHNIIFPLISIISLHFSIISLSPIIYGSWILILRYSREFTVACYHWASWKSRTANVLLLFKGIIVSFFTIVDNWELSANLGYQKHQIKNPHFDKYIFPIRFFRVIRKIFVVLLFSLESWPRPLLWNLFLFKNFKFFKYQHSRILSKGVG